LAPAFDSAEEVVADLACPPPQGGEVLADPARQGARALVPHTLPRPKLAVALVRACLHKLALTAAVEAPS